ncbi:phosphopantetheine-binding protein [Streptosporangium lutulentum]
MRDAVVVAHGGEGAARLVGYLVPEEGAEVEPSAVRTALGGVLPPHAVPSVLVTLDRLPLSPNGKVDRAALPAPAARSTPSGQDRRDERGEVPDDPLVERVAGAWRDVLDVGTVGPDDDFFDLGGDSFAAVRAVRAVREDLRVVELFVNPTPRRLAARIAELTAATASGVAARTGCCTGSPLSRSGSRS